MRRYVDGPLVAFVVVMVAAASITSHGTYLFYSYFLPNELAYAATVVLTAGIPLLELAAVLDKEHRPRYIAGMVWLLLMEGVAQYFQGQAVFAVRVAAAFSDPTGVDLAMFAASPWGRILPAGYLAALSGVVVYFGYAASVRVRDLRGVPQPTTSPVAEETTSVLADLQALARKLRDEGKSWKETAEAVGRSPSTVRGWLEG